jgi:hypothetical protein
MYFSVLEPLSAATNFVKCYPLTITPPKNSDIEVSFPGYNASADVLSSVEDIVLLFQSVRPFLYASNSGNWTNQLAYFITSFVSELGRHIGIYLELLFISFISHLFLSLLIFFVLILMLFWLICMEDSL